MKDKIAYLTARYDELEAKARAVRPLETVNVWGTLHPQSWGFVRHSWRSEDGAGFNEPDDAAPLHFYQWTPEFVLADIASKRAVLALHEAELERELDKPAHRVAPDALGAWIMKKDIIDALLQPFAGRDDFPKEWRA